MKRYVVSYYDTVTYEYVVDAENMDQAILLTQDRYENRSYRDAAIVEHGGTFVRSVDEDDDG